MVHLIRHHPENEALILLCLEILNKILKDKALRAMIEIETVIELFLIILKLKYSNWEVKYKAARLLFDLCVDHRVKTAIFSMQIDKILIWHIKEEIENPDTVYYIVKIL